MDISNSYIIEEFLGISKGPLQNSVKFLINERIFIISYFFQPLRRALGRMGLPAHMLSMLIPDQMDNFLNYKIINNLKKLKNQVLSYALVY